MRHCPTCGRRLAAKNHIFESATRTPLRQAVAPPMYLPGTSYPPLPNITQPIGQQPSMEANVHVPANQAIVGGCLCAPAVGLIVYTIGVFGGLSTGPAIQAGFIAGGITMFVVGAVSWFRKTAFYDGLLLVETALDVDLDGDGEIGIVKVEVQSEGGEKWQFADLPGRPAALREFAKRVLSGQGFTDETGKLSGLTQREVRDLREAFIEKGWARWKHQQRKQQGIDITRIGAAVLRAIADPSPPLSGAAGS
jgi:hypothetical protein